MMFFNEVYVYTYRLISAHQLIGAYWLSDQEPQYRRRMVFCTVLCPTTGLHTSLSMSILFYYRYSCVTAVRYDYTDFLQTITIELANGDLLH